MTGPEGEAVKSKDTVSDLNVKLKAAEKLPEDVPYERDRCKLSCSNLNLGMIRWLKASLASKVRSIASGHG